MNLERLITDQAAAIAMQADAIATGRLVGPRHAAAARLLENVTTLLAWIDRADGWGEPQPLIEVLEEDESR